MEAEAVEKEFFTLLRNVSKGKIPAQNLKDYIREIEEFCDLNGMEISEFLEDVFYDEIGTEVYEIINDSEWRSDNVGKKCVINPEILREIFPILTKIDENTELVFATNPNTPIEILNALSESTFNWEEDSTTSCLARNTSNEKLLRLLAIKSDASTRYSVATNPKTPVDILQLLATDEQFSEHMLYLRFDGGMSSSATDPAEEIVRCSIKFAVLHNVKTPLEIVSQIASNEKNFDDKPCITFFDSEKVNVNLALKQEAEKILQSRS